MIRSIQTCVFLLALTTPAFADDPKPCGSVAELRHTATTAGGSIIELNHDQWEFLRGVYVANPNTPPGLPPGKDAILVLSPSGNDAYIFYIDGPKACFPLHMHGLPLLKALDDIKSGKTTHAPKEDTF